MKTIWKVTLDVEDLQSVNLPKGAEILTVQVQSGWIQLWALVDPEEPNWARDIEIFGTGHPMPSGIARRYIGTVQTHEGKLVWHIFERIQ